MDGRFVRESASEYSEIALPIYANPLGDLLGGRVMHLVDMAGALAASRHSRQAVVTASVDQMTFLRPVHIGQLVVVRSTVNRSFRSSMEVGVKVMVEDLGTGEVRHTSSAYLTFVALDAEGRPVEIPSVTPETSAEKRRYQDAGQRRSIRLEQRTRAREKDAS